MTNKYVWDSIAEEYDCQYHAVTDWRLGYSAVEDLLGEAASGQISGKKILDYGCGSGKFSRRLRDLGALVTAVDISENAINKAKKKDQNRIDYRFIKDDNISFLERESLDYAVAAFVSCTMQEEYQIRNIAQSIQEKLKIGGYFIILEPHPDSLGFDYISMKREMPEEIKSGMPIKVQLTGMDTKFYDYWRSKEDYLRILKTAGMELDSIREPIVKDFPEETFWKDERIQAPLLILRAKTICPKIKF